MTARAYIDSESVLHCPCGKGTRVDKSATPYRCKSCGKAYEVKPPQTIRTLVEVKGGR